MEKKNLTNEQMEQFINDNMDKVPARSLTKFNGMTTEQKYKRMTWYVKNAEERKLYADLTRPCREFARIINSTYMTMKDAEKMQELLNHWIEENKEYEIKRIEEEIARLTSMKKELSK